MRLPSYPSYRESEIAWLDSIPEHWRAKKLRHLALLKSGENIVAEELEDEGTYPVYGGNGLRGYSSRFTHDGDYALIGRQGALCGNINYATGKFWASEHAVVVQPLSQFATFWMGELLRAMNLNQYSVSAAQPGLSVDAISALRIPVPPPDEQQAIADFLDRETARLDTLVGKKRDLIEKLKEKRTALISRTVTRGLPPEAARAAALNPHPKLKPSGIEWLGDIPEHWALGKLGSATEAIGDGLHGTPDYVDDSGIYFVNGNNLFAGTVTFFENTRQVSAETYSRYRLPLSTTTVLMSINGTIGNLALYNSEKIMLGKSAAFMNCGATLDRRFLVKYLESAGVRQFFDLELTGTTIFNLSLESIRRTPLALPALPEQRAIADYLDRETTKIDKMVEKVEAAIEKLQEYRTALITAAVTGKIDVRGTLV